MKCVWAMRSLQGFLASGLRPDSQCHQPSRWPPCGSTATAGGAPEPCRACLGEQAVHWWLHACHCRQSNEGSSHRGTHYNESVRQSQEDAHIAKVLSASAQMAVPSNTVSPGRMCSTAGGRAQAVQHGRGPGTGCAARQGAGHRLWSRQLRHCLS